MDHAARISPPGAGERGLTVPRSLARMAFGHNIGGNDHSGHTPGPLLAVAGTWARQPLGGLPQRRLA